MRRILRALYGLVLAIIGVFALGAGVALALGDFPVWIRALGVLVFGSSWLVYRFGFPFGLRLFGPPAA